MCVVDKACRLVLRSRGRCSARRQAKSKIQFRMVCEVGCEVGLVKMEVVSIEI